MTALLGVVDRPIVLDEQKPGKNPLPGWWSQPLGPFGTNPFPEEADEPSEAEIATLLWIAAEARHLLRLGWCRFNLAMSEAGVCCPVDAPEAAQFCLGGAIRLAAVRAQERGHPEAGSARDLLFERLNEALARALPAGTPPMFGDFVHYNDWVAEDVDHVLGLLDHTVAALKEGR